MPTPKKEQLNDHVLPPYILEGSNEANKWFDGEYDGKIPGAPTKKDVPSSHDSLHQHESHFAAMNGRIDDLKRIAEEEKEALYAKDKNGWTPLHEAARRGDKEVIEFLSGHGVDLDILTNPNTGYSALDLAMEYHGNDFVDWLKSLGASKINHPHDDSSMKSEL